MRKKKSNMSRRKMIKIGGLAAGGISTTTFAHASTELNQLNQVSNKVAFITGGARGIGRAIAVELAKEGNNIALFDIADQMGTVPYPMSNNSDMTVTKNLVEAEGMRCLTLKGDVRNSEDLKSALEKTVSTLGRLDIVIANAGIANMGMIEQMADDAWEDVIGVNLIGVAKTLKASIPHLRKQKEGRIVVIASVSGRGGSPGMSAYNSSKWGVIGLTKSVAGEVGNANITCNAICPTAIATPMLENDFVRNLWSPSDPTSEGINQAMKRSHLLPIGMLDPIEIANATVFLCSEKAKAITGIAMDVAAGSTARNNA